MNRLFSRRQLLGSTVLAAMGSALDGTRLLGSDELVEAYAVLDAKVGLRIAGLGAAYLRHNAIERSQYRLAELIKNFHIGSLAAAFHHGEPGMQVALEQAYRSDFDRGHYVRVEGWTLSITEVRLHAYRHLANI